MPKKAKVPAIRFKGFTDAWEQRELGELCCAYSDKTEKENEDVLLSCAIEGMFLNSELFSHQRGASNIGYQKIKKGDLILSAQNLHLGNANVNLRFEHGIISPAYKVFAVIGCLPEFLSVWVKKEDTNNFFLDATTAGASLCRKNVEWKTLYAQKLPIPSEPEQKRIAEFFLKLNDLITLHQRKLLKIKNIKKAMLEKMFPKNGSNVPEIRFTGFTDAWEQRKFSEIFVHLKNNSLSRADLNYERGSVKNVHYGDVLIKFAEILDVQNEELPYVSNDGFDISSASLLQDGDIIIADAAEDETVGKCSEIRGVMDLNVVSGLHTISCRPTKTFATGYLGYHMNSTAYHDQLLPLIQGTKISSISKSALQNTDIIYPCSEDEQRQIGAYFNNLDHLITLHQRKYEKLQNLKKACLEKMFV